MSSDADVHAASSRKALKVAVAALCSEVGFGNAEEAAIETLTESLQSFLLELGRSSKSYAELAGRTDGLVTDVFMAAIEMGINIESIPAYSKRSNKTILLPPSHVAPQAAAKTLQAGDKQPHPSHVPEYLPSFPDPHTYIRTETHKQPSKEYQVIREKAASQKRDVERALTRFIAKTGETQTLFKDDLNAFPLIAVKPSPQPYLNALLPKDQDLDAQEPVEVQRAASKRQRETRDLPHGSGTDIPPEQSDSSSNLAGLDSSDPDAIDNPYLRPVRMPRFRKKVRY